MDNLFNGRGDKTFRQTFDYSRVLTGPLLTALRAAEMVMVQKTCSGDYSPLGEICGLDYGPIPCAQDFEYPYKYRTEHVASGQAIIAYATPRGDRPNATYRLVKLGKVWKIDGIACGYIDVRFHADDLH